MSHTAPAAFGLPGISIKPITVLGQIARGARLLAVSLSLAFRAEAGEPLGVADARRAGLIQ